MSLRLLLAALLAVSAYLTPGLPAHADPPPILDATFGADGVADASIPGLKVRWTAVTTDRHGRVVAVGNAQFPGVLFHRVVARFLPDGTLDQDFGDGGYSLSSDATNTKSDLAADVTIDWYDRIIVAGSMIGPHPEYDALVARYTDDGSLDDTYGVGGVATASVGTEDMVSSVQIAPNGDAVVSGISDDATLFGYFAVAFNPQGSPDPGFGDNGIAEAFVNNDYAYATGMSIRANGSVLIGGYALFDVPLGGFYRGVAVQFGPDGSLDPSFGAGGVSIYTLGAEQMTGGRIMLTAQGRAIVSGTGFFASGKDLVIGRLLRDGAMDPTFGSNGGARIDLGGEEAGLALGVQTDGKTLVSASSTNGLGRLADLIRLDRHGDLDPAFGIGGVQRVDPALALGRLYIQPADGKLLFPGVQVVDATSVPVLVRMSVEPVQSQILAPRSDSLERRTFHRIAGTAAGGGLFRVNVAVHRKDRQLLMTRHRCQWVVDLSGTLHSFPATRDGGRWGCSAPRSWFRARGLGQWRLRTIPGWRPGRYDIVSRALSAGGSHEKGFSARRGNLRTVVLR